MRELFENVLHAPKNLFETPPPEKVKPIGLQKEKSGARVVMEAEVSEQTSLLVVLESPSHNDSIVHSWIVPREWLPHLNPDEPRGKTYGLSPEQEALLQRMDAFAPLAEDPELDRLADLAAGSRSSRKLDVNKWATRLANDVVNADD